MKTTKLLTNLMFNIVMGVLLASVLGVETAYGAVAGVAIPAAASALGAFEPKGAAMEGVFRELWTGYLVKALRGGMTANWLNGVTDMSAVVGNEAVHLVDVGADPEVLINNTTYPIPVQEIDDGDIVIGLDKYQTKATPVTDDELYAMSYDKMSSLIERHAEAILLKKYAKAAHALAPLSHTDKTPVIQTSGEADADGRKKLTRKDVIALKRKLDALQIPVQGRRLVLCSDHVNDLLEEDQKFRDQYYNYTTGKIANMYGFEIYEFENCPIYTKEGVKKNFGESAGATDHQASFFFYVRRAWRAQGTTKMYYSEAATDPENQRNLVNFRHYFIVMPMKQEAIGAIYSWDGSTAQTKDSPVTAYKYWGEVRREAKEAAMASAVSEQGPEVPEDPEQELEP